MNRLWIRLSMVYAATILTFVSILPLIIFYVQPQPEILNLPMLTQLSEDDMALLNQLNESGALERTFRQSVPIQLFAIVIMTGLAGTIASIAASWWITRPLIVLEDGTRKIAEREMGHRVEIQGTSEIKSLAESFNSMAEAIEVAEERRQHLLADVSHELRTPLTVLQGHLRGILDDVYRFDKGEIAKLYEQTQHLNHLVDDLHDIAQAEANRLALQMTTVDVSRLLRQVAEVFQPLAQDADIDLNVSVRGQVSMIRSDERRLMQVLQNLISNSLRYARSHINLSLEQQGNQLVLIVADDGIGISPHQLPHIFDRFYRADSSRNRETGGTGLGLAIVKSIVEALHGQIEVDSVINQGTRFRILLPTVFQEKRKPKNDISR